MNMMNTLLVSFVIAAVDQLVKLYIRTLPMGAVVFRIPYVLEITHYTNTGAVFSMLSGHTLLLAAVSSALLCLITYMVFARMHLSDAGKTAYAALLGGGIGNLIDRLLLGGVTDYIRLLFVRFPVFNLADIAITLSAFCLFFLTLTGKLEICTGEEHGSDH